MAIVSVILRTYSTLLTLEANTELSSFLLTGIHQLHFFSDPISVLNIGLYLKLIQYGCHLSNRASSLEALKLKAHAQDELLINVICNT